MSETPMSDEKLTEDVVATICHSDIEWRSEAWTSSDRSFPAKDQFEKELALAALLANEVIFLNDHWWMKDWPEEAQKTTSLNVNCNDVFAWGCADAESCTIHDLPDIYRMWRKDPQWGAAVWCMKKRNQMPQPPLERMIRVAGIWSFEELGLAPNTLDAEVASMFKAAQPPTS